MSLSENILDEDLSRVTEKKFVRNLNIHRIEKAVTISYLATLAYYIWDTIIYILHNLLSHLIILTIYNFLSIILVLTSIVWWRIESIKYDSNNNIDKIKLPYILSGLRILILLYLLRSASFNISHFMNLVFGYIESRLHNNASFSDMKYDFLITSLCIALALLHIYYLYITQKTMHFINQ